MTGILTWTGLLLGIALLCGGCGASEEPPGSPPAAPATPPPAPSPPESSPPESPKPPPPGEAAPAAPTGSLRGDAGRGGALYAQYCTVCHGKTGRGDGPTAAGLPTPPANHTDPVAMRKLSDLDLYTVIKDGGPAVGKSPLMAAWGQLLSDEQIRDLLAHVRQLSGT